MDYIKAWFAGMIAFVIGWVYGKVYFAEDKDTD